MLKALKNPTDKEIIELIKKSKYKAVRRIIDKRNNNVWCWDATQATHMEGAKQLKVPYNLLPGCGDILTI